MRQILFALIGIIVAGGAFWLWQTNAPSEESRSTDRVRQGVTWDPHHILTASGDTLLSIDELPDTIQVSAESHFGSPERFTGAALAPDSSWLAVSTSGAVHGFGWLYDMSTEIVYPAAFQYGGEVRFGSWSPDGRFAAFVQRSPAPTTKIKLVDRQSIQNVVSATGSVIQVAAEEELDPPYVYRIERWEPPHTLCFRLAGSEYCVDAGTQERPTCALHRRTGATRGVLFSLSLLFSGYGAPAP